MTFCAGRCCKSLRTLWRPSYRVTSQRTQPYRVGTLGFAERAARIPIYGCEQVDLERRTNYSYDANMISTFAVKWKGDEALEYRFDFELVAGVTTTDRRELYDFMKVGHALVAHQLPQGDKVLAPPPAHLILGRFINSRGFVKSCHLSASGPWDADMFPTSCKFTGTFVIAPGYKGDVVGIEQQRRMLSSEYLLRSFYYTSG